MEIQQKNALYGRFFMPGILTLYTFMLAPLHAAGTEPSCRTDAYSAHVTIRYVIDGDTVKLSSGKSLRLIGLDTPEIGHDGSRDERGARAAADHLKSLLPGTPSLPVVFGVERHDHFGRLLGHLFLADGTNIQSLLLGGGYGTPLIIPPNLRFLDCYRAKADTAIAAKRGIWSYREYQIMDADEVTPLSHGYHRIQGIVTRTGSSSSSLWVNMGTHLALRIVRSDLKYFTGIDISGLTGRTVLARGLVYRRKGQARIRIRHPQDLRIMGD